MSYGLMYTVPFADISNIPCVVEIEKEGYIGTPTELVGGSSPFVVKIDDEEFMYVPTRFSDATIRVVGGDSLQSLFATGYQEYRVTFKKNSLVRWCGFIKPEVYTQDYSSNIFELEIECMSAMSTLEYIKYSQYRGTEIYEREFVSFSGILKQCIDEANVVYNKILIPHVYAKSLNDFNSNQNILDEIVVSEQNFYNEDNEPMSLKEVIEEVCKFMNWTCVEWSGDLVFVDVDNTGDYLTFSNGLSYLGNTNINEMNIQNIGFRGSDHSLDILPGYNKVTVKNSNYGLESILDFKVEYERLKTLGTQVLQLSDELSNVLLYNSSGYNMYQYLSGKVVDLDNYIGNPNGAWYNILGPIPIKYSNYKIKDGKPDITEYSYTEALRIRYHGANGTKIGQDTAILNVYSPPIALPKGIICINCSAKYSSDGNMYTFRNDRYDGDLIMGFRLLIGNRDYTDEHPIPGSFIKCGYLNFGKYDSKSEYNEVKNDKTLNMPYDGAKGKIVNVDLQNTITAGSIKFKLLAEAYPYVLDKYGIFLKDLNIKFIPENGKKGAEREDMIYENVINEKFVNELDEIEFKINSFADDDGASFSKALYKGFLSYQYQDYIKENMYSCIEGKLVRPEKSLIKRIINRYSGTKIKLTQVIKELPDITPITQLSDNFMTNKKFIVTGGEIDFANEAFTCVMTEL